MSSDLSRRQATRTRRDVLSAGLAGCAGCLLAGCSNKTGPAATNDTGDGASPAGDAPVLSLGPVDAGPASAFARDGIHDAFARQGFFVVRRGRRLFAVSSVCTHQQVILDAGSDDLGCPRHGSLFTPDGDVVKVPARLPLPRHAVRVDGRAHLVVDTSVRFEKPQWDAAGAVVSG